MKKLIPIIILLLTFLSCSSDDGYYNVQVIEKGSYNTTSKNENGKYYNDFFAIVENKSSTPIKGHVRFKVKDYGYINSITETINNQGAYQHTFGAELETDEIIDESYLLNAVFVRE